VAPGVRDGEEGHRVDGVVGQDRMDEFGAALDDKIGAVFCPQAIDVGDVADEHRALARAPQQLSRRN
jgi:hypothetical protein